MKRILVIVMLMIGMGLKAQCPLNQAVDFTATDVHGTQIHLFDILDRGQYVLIDFFFTTCGPCQQATPKIVQAYYSFGCNMHDVFFMEIASGDSEAACLNWVNNYGVEYPTIAGTTGGTNICQNLYHIQAYPTVILIAPDHTILIPDLYPIPSAQAIINPLTAYGIQLHDCNEPSGELTITPDTLWFDNMSETQSFTILNETDTVVTIEDVVPEGGSYLEIWQPSFPVSLEAGQSIRVNVGMQVPPLKDDYTAFSIDVLTSMGERQVTAMVQNTALDMGLILGPYFVVALDSINPTLDLYLANGNAGTQTPMEIYSIEEDLSEGGPYLIIELPTELPITLNANEEFHFFISPIYSGERSFVNTSIIVNYNGGSLNYIVSIDGELLSVKEIHNSLQLYPNPANDFVTLKGENLGTVQVYNTLGQMMDAFEANGTELNINTSKYESGIYIVKSSKKILRLFVKH